MHQPDSLYTIILAAGEGRRMRSRERHKVCFEVAGVPTIVRAIDAYNRLGAALNVVVVGDKAGQVVETVGQRFSNVVFAFQQQARGTGDAAGCGLRALPSIDPQTRLLVVAGDKLVDFARLSRLVEGSRTDELDLAFLATPAQLGGASAGRILTDGEGRPRAIAEMSDIRLRQARQAAIEHVQACAQKHVTWHELQPIVAAQLGPEAALGDLLGGGDFSAAEPFERDELLATLKRLPTEFELGPDTDTISPAAAEDARLHNESVYLVRKRWLEYGLRHMNSDTAQGQEYLTDAIGAVLTARPDDTAPPAVGCVETQSAEEVMAYNNPEELLHIESTYRGRQSESESQMQVRVGAARYRTVEEWLAFFPAADVAAPETDVALAKVYGVSDPELLADRRDAYRRVLLEFASRFDARRRVILVRAPGRINIIGRHIDWQGGHCNLMAVNQEVLVAAAPRHDDRIELRNVEPDSFPDASISLGSLIGQLEWDDWLRCVNGARLEEHLRRASGEWRIYVEAAMLRLQMAYRDRLLPGLDMVVCGNIPLAAGMSSSSALVVATAEAAVALAGLDVLPRQFVNFCGEGEWFVGTRGGSADHAAMKFGAAGAITHVKFHEFEVLRQIRFPDTHRLVVCNSFTQARKAAGAKSAFNARVASYLAGVEMVRKRFPHVAPLVTYVRDIEPEHLHVGVEEIYRLLLAVPEEMTAAEIAAEFRHDHETWDKLAPHFAGAAAGDVYPVRGVVLFGIGECARAREAARLFESGAAEELGRLMQTSHDGERCYRVEDDLTATAWSADVSDDYLRRRIADAESGNASRAAQAALHRQPGGYRASTQQIDALVDIAGRTPGVAGAQIAGAGLGGCAMVLVEVDAVERLTQRLNRLFYEPQQLPSGVVQCIPAAGSGLVEIEQTASVVV